ncbi:hypothetical protein J6590_029500 [Homalodisca vitripennis]|nr:hypothetical protein J6590_029500 [Homalodisca vitripennis]
MEAFRGALSRSAGEPLPPRGAMLMVRTSLLAEQVPCDWRGGVARRGRGHCAHTGQIAYHRHTGDIHSGDRGVTTSLPSRVTGNCGVRIPEHHGRVATRLRASGSLGTEALSAPEDHVRPSPPSPGARGSAPPPSPPPSTPGPRHGPQGGTSHLQSTGGRSGMDATGSRRADQVPNLAVTLTQVRTCFRVVSTHS